MAYVTIIKQCYDGSHEDCPERENTPVQIEGKDVICGGGICVCECHHGGERNKFIESVWEQAKQRYESTPT